MVIFYPLVERARDKTALGECQRRDLIIDEAMGK